MVAGQGSTIFFFSQQDQQNTGTHYLPIGDHRGSSSGSRIGSLVLPAFIQPFNSSAHNVQSLLVMYRTLRMFWFSLLFYVSFFFLSFSNYPTSYSLTRFFSFIIIIIIISFLCRPFESIRSCRVSSPGEISPAVISLLLSQEFIWLVGYARRFLIAAHPHLLRKKQHANQQHNRRRVHIARCVVFCRQPRDILHLLE